MNRKLGDQRHSLRSHDGAMIRLGRACRCSRGSALIEMALVMPMLLVLFASIFEFSRMFHTRLTARHAVIEATRYAVTGNQLTDDESGDLLDRATSIRRIVAERAYALPVTPEAIVIDPADGGGPEDVVRITLIYSYDYALPGFMDVLPELQFSVAAAMRNEPFYGTAGS
ncbi:MAG: pilus assembly protein [Gemmatimonadetes bacterium]|nr:pilus assembly protein [Gemmatimonadota bacterium]MCK5483081.1 pilus assembly protein [Gemmatimonadota bacterium]